MECYLSVSNLVFKNTYIVAKTGTNACHTQKKLSQDEKKMAKIRAEGVNIS